MLSFRRLHSSRQRGFVLILVVLTMLAILGTVLLVGIAGSTSNRERQNVTNQSNEAVLARAKEALIGYLVSPPDPNIRPGVLPIPNALTSVSAKYSGLDTDSNGCIDVNNAATIPYGVANSTSTRKRCLGKIPWKTLGLDLGQLDAADVTGVVPWVAMSANLVNYDNCLFVLNSDIANLASPSTPSCPVLSAPYPQPTELPHPWLTVRDIAGNILSDKVAIVLILPGPPIATETRSQNRSLAAPGGHKDYLDSIKLPLGCTLSCTTYDNADLTNQFIQIPTGTLYPLDAADISKRGQPVPFNDVVVYLTIDEVMYYIERRVLAEMVSSLRRFRSDPTTGFTKTPWPAPLNQTYTDSLSLYAVPNNMFGAFPFMINSSSFSFKSEFQWALSSATETTSWRNVSLTTGTTANCRQIKSSPNTWIRNHLVGTLNNFVGGLGPFNVGARPLSTGVCRWTGESGVYCESTDTVVNRIFDTYSTQATCNTQTLPTGMISLPVARKVVLSGAATDCAAAPSSSYVPASSSDVHRWSWSCTGILPAALDVRDTVSDPTGGTLTGLPRVANLVSAGAAQTFTLSAMRYYPQMPAWFVDNRWYLTSFVASSPDGVGSPSTLSPNTCGAVTQLNINGISQSGTFVVLAGKSLMGQVRPSANIADYFDTSNASISTSCMLSNDDRRNSALSNDNFLKAEQ
jgi:type II secretory pathway pseudopilin PulG